MTARYVGRFAPSPTGPLHFGSLVAALASYVDARAHEGRWHLRMEDVDTQRCSREDEAMIIRQLTAYGFEHDGEIMRQSERTAVYHNAIAALERKGVVYRCRCTRKSLAAARRSSEGEIVYPGTCRNAQIQNDAHRPSAVRLNLSALHIETPIAFEDRALGPIAQDLREQVGDFILLRADGDFAYQLAVVIDDAAQGITHVVRGADLLLNTPRQIALQHALGLTRPHYLHVPIAANEAGEKLSKQTLAPPLPMGHEDQLATLSRAWAFLRQSPLGAVASPRAFLKNAVAVWQPERLRALASVASAANL